MRNLISSSLNKTYFSNSIYNKKENSYGLPGTDSVTRRIPIRAIHTGISKNLSDREYNIVYDYYDFRASDFGILGYEVIILI